MQGPLRETLIVKEGSSPDREEDMLQRFPVRLGGAQSHSNEDSEQMEGISDPCKRP